MPTFSHSTNESIQYEPAVVFEKESPTLQYSEGCLGLLKDQTCQWLFEMIALYQTLPHFKQEHYQRWQFTKEGEVVFVCCYNQQEHIMTARLIDLGSYVKTFSEVTVYYLTESCCLAHEYLAFETSYEMKIALTLPLRTAKIL